MAQALGTFQWSYLALDILIYVWKVVLGIKQKKTLLSMQAHRIQLQYEGLAETVTQRLPVDV